MLLGLQIRDFVIVDRLELEFSGGFGALTGETGAGKSILVDALSLALGERADAGVVRHGAERAEVAAEFSVAADSEVAAWLVANDFDGETCLLRRVVETSGRSRAYINGAAATLGQLRELAEHLADIHGQHAHHSLLRSEAQRTLLDSHAGAGLLARDVAAAYAQWRKAREARVLAERDVEAAVREADLLRWQVDELKTLAFEPAAWLEAEQEQRRLANAADLIEAAAAALDVLDDGDNAALPPLRHAQSRLAELGGVDDGLAEIATHFESALIQLDEAAMALRRYRDRLDLDPDRLAELDQRIAAVTQAARKYRIAPEEIPNTLEALTGRLEEMCLRADPQALAAREAAAEREYRALAQKLSLQRQQAARDLGTEVSAAMQELALAGGRFAVELEALGEGAAYGLENVEFLVSANPGQPLRPLAKVVSGGELSRIGLALQVIASQAHSAGTLIFDEVDVGIGGRVAEVVGRMLRQLGSERQVLCVTHLPQVAAQADWQWSIAKRDEGNGIRSTVLALDTAERIDEIARMLGGEKITDTSRRHAAEMLAR